MCVSHDSMRHLYRLSEKNDCWSREYANSLKLTWSRLACLAEATFIPVLRPLNTGIPASRACSIVMLRLINVPSHIINPWRYAESPLIQRLSITFTSYYKREFLTRDQVSPYLSPTVHYFYTYISGWISGFTQFFIHENFVSCFYLLIFYFEKFSTGIWRLPFAIYVKLKLSNIMEVWWIAAKSSAKTLAMIDFLTHFWVPTSRFYCYRKVIFIVFSPSLEATKSYRCHKKIYFLL